MNSTTKYNSIYTSGWITLGRYTLILIIVMITGFANAQSTIWIANSNPGAIGGTNVKTGANAINDAITAALPGDIIQVIPSSVAYNDVHVTLGGLSFYGIGTNPQKEGNKVSYINNLYLSESADNTVISGMNVDHLYISDGSSQTINGALIENSYLGFIEVWYTNSTVKNLTLRSNIIGKSSIGGERISLYASANVKVINNIIVTDNSTSYCGITAANGTIISNNLFIGGTGANYNAFGNLNTCTVKNNIFYGLDMEGGKGSIPYISNTTFLNNISFGGIITDISAIVGANGVIDGGGNQWNTDPQLVNVPYAADWIFTYDPHLQGTSSALGAGTDGTDIGITGGMVPFNFAGTWLPLIQQVTPSSVINHGDTLHATLKAKGN